MTRAANSRKGTGSSTSTRAAPVFRGRDVVFVDPLDETMGYWWPAMIVPVPEIDSSMEIPSLNPGECLVKYFEDNTYSVVPMTDLQPFVPTTIPFLEYELAAGQKFLKNGGVVNALAYLETGKVKRKFSWHRFGTAQGQDLSLDMNKTKPITLPVVSDASFAAQGLKGNATTSSASSSPTISAANYTDTEDSKDEDDKKATLPSGLNTNGLRGSGPTSATLSSSPSTTASGALLPSQSGAKSIETMDEEFNGRSKVKSEVTATKDSHVRVRSRRSSRDSETKVTTQPSGTPTSDSVSETDSTKKGAPRRSRTTSEQPSPTQKNKGGSTTTIDTSNTAASSSRQGSVEPSQASSPRSTRHSFRSTMTSEQGEDSTDTNASEETTKPQPPRMTRTRSAPKTARSLKADEVKTDVPSQDSDPKPRSQMISSAPSLTQSSPSTSVSAISSPSSITEEELPGLSGVSSSSSSASLSPTFEQERRELNFNFENVFPTLAIGSKEREAFYETCMDHLQKLRREHRRLKQIVQSSEPKSRRGTRSSPSRHLQYNQRGNSPYSSSSSSSYYPNRSAPGPGVSSTAPSPPSSSNPSSSISLANGSNTTSGLAGPGGNTGGTTTARRSAATAAAAAVAATVSRSSRQSNNSQSSVTHEVSKKRTVVANGESSREVQTRAKRRLR
ncbi:hypothetical protein BGZ59_002244 [Podila verticillata]|nr:hypothetical protein BGZ59_002244 [Podila verticillata]KFH64626.1 hypothetical protein MVEG_09358 [Podila verticillata NRRL 6337]